MSPEQAHLENDARGKWHALRSGTITSAISILVHRPRRDNVQRVDKIYEKLVIQENIRTAMMVLGTLQGEAYERSANTIIEKLFDVQSKDREVPELPVGRQTGEMVPQLPTNVETDTNT